MKPDNIKSILKSYLKEKQHSSSYSNFAHYFQEAPEYMPDSYHGFSCATPKHGSEESSLMADIADVLMAQGGLPLASPDGPLEPRLEAMAQRIGHQLCRMSDRFDPNLIPAVNNQASVNGRSCIQFKECVIRVPVTCDRVQIPVIRTGAVGGVVNGAWTTCDKSAKAGLHYVNGQGNISFAEGDEEMTIEVEIIRNQAQSDIHFIVELFDAEGTFNTVTVYIVDDSKLYPDEKHFIKNIFNCTRKISMSALVTRLSDIVTHNTFKAALQCLCSSADSIPKELALACELLRLTMPHAPESTLTDVFCEHFSYLPELEVISCLL